MHRERTCRALDDILGIGEVNAKLLQVCCSFWYGKPLRQTHILGGLTSIFCCVCCLEILDTGHVRYGECRGQSCGALRTCVILVHTKNPLQPGEGLQVPDQISGQLGRQAVAAVHFSAWKPSTPSRTAGGSAPGVARPSQKESRRTRVLMLLATLALALPLLWEKYDRRRQ